MAEFSAAQSNSSSPLKYGIGYGSNLGGTGIANIGNFTLYKHLPLGNIVTGFVHIL